MAPRLNSVRRHAALGYQPPCSAFQGSRNEQPCEKLHLVPHSIEAVVSLRKWLTENLRGTAV